MTTCERTFPYMQFFTLGLSKNLIMEAESDVSDREHVAPGKKVRVHM